MSNSTHSSHSPQLHDKIATPPASPPIPPSKAAAINAASEFLPTEPLQTLLHGAFHSLRIIPQRAGGIVAYIRVHPMHTLAAVFTLFVVAAVLEDPDLLPCSSEVIVGLIGGLCGGGLVLGVVQLESIDVGGGLVVGAWPGVDWGAVWRWGGDAMRYVRNEGGQSIVSDDDKNLVHERDGDARQMHTTPSLQGTIPLSYTGRTDTGPEQASAVSQQLPTMETHDSSSSPRGKQDNTLSVFSPSPPPISSLQQSNYPLSSSPSPLGQPQQQREHHAYPPRSPSTIQPSPRQQSNPAKPSLSQQDTHASGLLGASPIPLHLRARGKELEFKNFTGQGFYKYEQRLKAVGRWPVPGSGGGRSFEEILAEIEEVEDKGLFKRNIWE